MAEEVNPVSAENNNTATPTNAAPAVAKTTTHTSLISGMSWNKAKDGTPVVCAILKDSTLGLNTKTTIRSYLTALDGPVGAVDFVKTHLEEGDVNIMSGARITWERTVYPAGLPHDRAGESVILDQDDIIDHIVKVDLTPIKELLLDKMLENMGEVSSLREKILVRNFGIEL